ncbi:MAG: hypothetical protein H0U23_09775, partial [Blastocatellia bacterium]|nr:hypothetical protein [Blastocatellia bacterium]
VLLNISLTVSPITDASGKIIGVSKIEHDITERKQTEEALRQAHARLADRADQLEGAVTERTAELSATNSQLEAFVYSVAHDLRAPLRAMQGCSAMLVDEVGETLSEAGQGLANRINKSAQFMDALLKDLLAFSQISQERIELTAVSLKAVVQAVLTRLQSDIQDTHADVECVEPFGTVLAHAPTLGQVLFNLVSNALKFVTPGVTPRLRVRTEEKEASIRIWVEDNGIGIAPEHQEQIFRLFARLHREKYLGTGIGLTIVQKGVERMNGRVGVESMPPHGSHFWFELRKA